MRASPRNWGRCHGLKVGRHGHRTSLGRAPCEASVVRRRALTSNIVRTIRRLSLTMRLWLANRLQSAPQFPTRLTNAACRIVTFFVVMLTIAACDPLLEQQYYKEGIGTKLPTPDGATVTQLQDLYLAELCRQAGLVPATAPPEQLCLPNGTSQAWASITQAGLNDIDARCDAYLAWLDDKRRSKEPILAEINAVSAATQGIMQATQVGANPITIVGLAFGLASSTFTNVRSRLLLEVNHSTVQSVVLSRQQSFRNELKSLFIDTRAKAVYVLRSYLRICMPMTIEMQINTTVTVFEQTGSSGIRIKQDRPLINPATVAPGPGTTFTSSYLNDDAGAALTKYLYPNGIAGGRDPSAARAIADYIAQNKLNVGIPTFIRSTALSSERRRLARNLGLLP
jgi:hypothetical protein